MLGTKKQRMPHINIPCAPHWIFSKNKMYSFIFSFPWACRYRCRRYIVSLSLAVFRAKFVALESSKSAKKSSVLRVRADICTLSPKIRRAHELVRQRANGCVKATTRPPGQKPEGRTDFLTLPLFTSPDRSGGNAVPLYFRALATMYVCVTTVVYMRAVLLPSLLRATETCHAAHCFDCNPCRGPCLDSTTCRVCEVYTIRGRHLLPVIDEVCQTEQQTNHRRYPVTFRYIPVMRTCTYVV